MEAFTDALFAAVFLLASTLLILFIGELLGRHK